MPSIGIASIENELISDICQFVCDPLGYVKYAFPWRETGELENHPGPHSWQTKVLNDIGFHLQGPDRFTPLRIAVSSGHTIGKSALISMISQWAMSTCDDCRVVVTANKEVQLATKTWPEISKWFRLAINAHWWNMGATTIASKAKGHERTWRMDRETWSEENTAAFQGLHNLGKRIVVIYDEASEIPDKIWEVTQGGLTDKDTEIIWIAFGNPTKNTGRFRECFGRLKHRWITYQVDSRTVPGTNLEEIAKDVRDYGEDSDYIRVRVRGEFPRAGSSQFIPGDRVARARLRDVGDQSRAFKILSVDVARFGDDQTLVGVRQGLRFTVVEKLRGKDTMFVGHRVCDWMRELEPRTTVIDGDGIGGGVIDYVNLHMMEWMGKRKEWFRLEEFHGGGTPFDAFAYFNRRAEVWGRMRDWLETGSIPDDPELEMDLTGPEYMFSAKNQIQLEKKEDMKKRGLSSPDIGDCLAMSFAVYPVTKTYEEQEVEIQAKIEDPMALHFRRLAETERRQKAKQPLNWWD